MTTLGERVRALRKGLGLKQTQLSAMTGIGQSTLSEIETGELKDPGSKILNELCKVLRTNERWLLQGSTAKPGPVEVANGFDEVEILQLMRKLDEGHAQSWLVTGRALLTHQLGYQTTHEPYPPAKPEAKPPAQPTPPPEPAKPVRSQSKARKARR